MALSVGFIFIISVPLILFGGALRVPSVDVRRIVLGICIVLSVIAGVLWLCGLKTLPLVVLAYVPAYQIELYAFVLNQFKNNYGREMQLIASGIVVDPELKKDARHSTMYFIGALCAPLLLLLILLP